MSGWQAMATLEAEHVAGRGTLARLEQAARDLQAGRLADALPVFKDSLAFFAGELEQHFKHEESALFPALARVIGRAGPIDAMLAEHESLWRSVDLFSLSVEELEDGGPAVDAKIVREAARNANHIAFLLRGHIEREDTMLFPLAEQSLREQQKREVDRDIEVLDRGRVPRSRFQVQS